VLLLVLRLFKKLLTILLLLNNSNILEALLAVLDAADGNAVAPISASPEQCALPGGLWSSGT